MAYESTEKIVECLFAAEANRLRLIRCIIKDATEFIGIDEKISSDLVLAVNEACMNIIQHAYENQPNKEIHLTISRIERGIVFILQDDAPCVEPSRIKPRSLSIIRPGGLGVHFIQKIMDEMKYKECRDRGNTLVLTKYI